MVASLGKGAIMRRDLAIGLALVCALAGDGHADGECTLPAGSSGTMAKRGSQCVLLSDVTLAGPFRVASFMHLNCQGHRILPIAPGSGTPPGDVSSNPEVALVLDRGVHDAKIQNCLIGGADGETGTSFDFAIVGRSSSGAKIMSNTINYRYFGIKLVNVDDTMVIGNTLNQFHPGGIGVILQGDSDGNRVIGNRIKRVPAGAPTARRTEPGRLGGAGAANAFGIQVLTARGSAVTPSVIAGVLEMVPQSPDHEPLNEDNLIDGNSIDMNRGSAATLPENAEAARGISLVDFATRTGVYNNDVINSQHGLGVNINPVGSSTQGSTRSIPGSCSGGSGAGRPCGSNGDCFLGAPFYTDTVAGTCVGATSVASDPYPHDSVVEGNTVTNAGTGLSISASRGVTLRGNTVQGCTIGIALIGPGLDAGTLVTRNTLTDNLRGLTLGTLLAGMEPPPASFGARVLLNDITDSSVQAVGKGAGYLLPSELSWLSEGNYWGRDTCPGFTGADTPDPGLIADSHAFITPVAGSGTGTQCPP